MKRDEKIERKLMQRGIDVEIFNASLRTFGATWKPGKQSATTRLKEFLDEAICRYALNRNGPDLEGVSRLSPPLHFGTLSPRQIWYAVKDWMIKAPNNQVRQSGQSFLCQMGWREFAYHLLWHFCDCVPNSRSIRNSESCLGRRTRVLSCLGNMAGLVTRL